MVRHSHRLVVAALAALATSVAVGDVTLSAQGPRARSGRTAMVAGMGLRALDLTEAQRQQVRQLTEQYREQTKPLMDRVQAAQEARRQALEAIPFNEQQIRSASQALAEVEVELAVQRGRFQSDVYALLTPEQQARLQKMRADREARMKERMGRLQQRGRRGARPQA